MAHHRPYLKPFSSPSSKHTSPTRVPIKPSLLGSTTRKVSVPEIANFNMPIPADVINLVSKSDRECTLKIFKARQHEDRAFGPQGDEPLVKKGNAYIDSILKSDTTLTVEFLVDKGKKNFTKRKNQKMMGSMYVNDLWAKHYDVQIRKHARIDVELKNLEYQKRRPLFLKLDDAVGHFEQKHVNSARAADAPKIFAFNLRENASLVTEMGYHCESEREFRTERPFATEIKVDNLEEVSVKPEKSPKALLLPNIKFMERSPSNRVEKEDTTMCTSNPVSAKRQSRDRMMFDFQSRKSGMMMTEPAEGKVKGLHFDFDTFEERLSICSTERSGNTAITQDVKVKRSRKQKSVFAETRGAFDNFLNMCQPDKNGVKEMCSTMRGARELWFRGAYDRQKRQKEIKKEQLMEECANSMKKKRERQGKQLSM